MAENYKSPLPDYPDLSAQAAPPSYSTEQASSNYPAQQQNDANDTNYLMQQMYAASNQPQAYPSSPQQTYPVNTGYPSTQQLGYPSAQQQGYPQQVGYANPSMVVVQQQAPATIVVVNQQPGPLVIYPQHIREWESGLCGCCDDCQSCCMVTWIPCVEAAHIGDQLKEDSSCCLCWGPGPGLLGALFGLSWRCIPCEVAMRSEVRAMMGIRGSICSDCCCVTCCPCLTLCQISRQMKAAKHLL